MILIRRASPADAVTVSNLIDISGRGGKLPLMALVFPGNLEERTRLIKWLFLHGRDVYMYYKNYFVAEVDGRIAGALCTFDISQDNISSWWKTFRKMDLHFYEPFCIAFRLIPYFLVIPKIYPGTLVVETVATFTEFRQSGVALSLLNAAIEEGRKRNYLSIQVSSLIGNEAALAVYKKAGFVEFGKKTSTLFYKKVGVLGMHHLKMDL